MNRHIKRAIASALIVSLSHTPVLGNLTLATASAQTTQNTTYTYQYDNMGNPTQVTDALGNVTTTNYDPLLRVKQLIQPAPVAGVARPTSNFTYDGLGQSSTVIDPRNLTTTYVSDGLGNQTTLISPDTGTSGRTFDAAGNLLTSTDARGKVSTYTYDALNRVTSISYTSGTPIVFEYDGGPSGAAYAVGRLTRMTDESGQTGYSYDQNGRLLSKVQTTVNPAATVTRQISYAYASNGQLLSMTYPSGSRVNYAYDANGRISQLVLNPPDGNGGTDAGVFTILLDQITYAPFGAAQSWSWGNSTATMPNLYSRSFDLDGRLQSYPLGNPALSPQGLIRTVNYDAANRITGYTHSGSATAASYDQTFGYDGLGRLTSFVTAASSQSYGYDASGNRVGLSIGGTTFTNAISTTSNRLNATTGPLPAKTNAIDNAGNLTSDGTTNFVYSDRGRLKSATKAGLTTNYLYNGLGQRVSKHGGAVPSGSNEFIFDEAGRLIGEYDVSGAPLQETIWLDGEPVVVLKSSGTPSPAIYYVYNDHLATPRVITDSASNNVVWNWIDTDPFGMTQPNETLSGARVGFNMRFPGQYFDSETALHYNYFRDYDPQTGRYIQSDPIGIEGGINTYGYVGGNPLSHIDPNGLQAFAIPAPPLPAPGYSPASGAGSSPNAMANDGAGRGRGRETAAQARSRDECPPDKKDPCEEIRKKIREIEQKLASKERQLANPTHDLYNRAYDTNPGGDLAGKGTYVGHLTQIEGLRVGLERAKAQARSMGCM
ncbi:RHS repeat-associated core domain-containing protein [Duganella radicis]|uniref:Type IV secretion protein Rhs n=1 Tax=Duganella radicis TaxID=551988 RepID=A0A6L6PB96_9BURK|nr:RHS repeat-associated core domain-containing protein [Duganella radicis]MTV36234.1 type IV secretion protein Rhs [Duganella radicis]